MARGGARNRSGPAADPASGRSDRRGFSLTALPSEGYRGEVPPIEDFMPAPTARHRAVWAQLWTTPQACAWSMSPWCWPVVADLVRYMVRNEASDAPVNMGTIVRQLRDDVGLSHAGLIAHRWAVAVDEVASKRAEPSETASRPSSRDRLKAVGDGGD
jgi:hypothetical protein